MPRLRLAGPLLALKSRLPPCSVNPSPALRLFAPPPKPGPFLSVTSEPRMKASSPAEAWRVSISVFYGTPEDPAARVVLALSKFA
ncbi:hypothetical protein BHAOGJBA_4644 [Methylobacterium hispanicum]|uniref:Uncharacterized protein n=1 Tax=Methylobacterium hispanicum TaxID=270350 RepID=A0AAV4ZSB3_9HYPH|nr:hypothetical protein BHAOGJBA_4644 [Methylobacterium hispanicum]